MTKELATTIAIQAMKQTGQRYSIAQVRNGQWMCERTEFVLNDPRGQMIYKNRPVIHLHPPGE